MQNSDNRPFISIGIPTYRRTAFIRQALESCLRQSYENYEIIVNDDTENDSIQSIVESYHSEKLRYIHNQPPLGLIPKLNDFLEKAKAEWMLILCDDDSLEPDYLKVLSQHIVSYPHATLIRCRYQLINSEGKELRLDRSNPLRMGPFEFLRDIFLPEDQSFKMNISGILFQKSLLRTLGGFKDFHRGWHVDRLAWTELGARGESICEPRALCNVRLHAVSITAGVEPNYKSAVATDLGMKKIVEKLFEGIFAKAKTPEDQENLKKARQNFHAYINRHLSKSLDQGFIAALQNKEKNPAEEIGKISEYMKELGVPLFRSVILYRFLAPLPYFFRISLLTKLQRYKTKKWTQ